MYLTELCCLNEWRTVYYRIFNFFLLENEKIHFAFCNIKEKLIQFLGVVEPTISVAIMNAHWLGGEFDIFNLFPNGIIFEMHFNQNSGRSTHGRSWDMPPNNCDVDSFPDQFLGATIEFANSRVRPHTTTNPVIVCVCVGPISIARIQLINVNFRYFWASLNLSIILPVRAGQRCVIQSRMTCLPSCSWSYGLSSQYSNFRSVVFAQLILHLSTC